MAIEVLEQGGALPQALPLWRYMKLSTLLLLLEGTTFFPSVATLRAADPLEGSLHPETAWLNAALSELHGQKAFNKLYHWLLSRAGDWVQEHWERIKNKADLDRALVAHLYQSELARRRAVWC